MADIDIERRPSRAWLWWLLGAVALALIVLAFTAGDDDDDAVAVAPATVEGVEPLAGEGTAPATTPTAGIVIAEIIANPTAWVGRSLSGEAQVGEVPTDRGFWITDQGQRLFVVLGDGPEEQPVDINANQRLRLNEVMVYPADQLGSIPGQLDADTRRIADGQPVVLYVHERNVSILGQS